MRKYALAAALALVALASPRATRADIDSFYYTGTFESKVGGTTITGPIVFDVTVDTAFGDIQGFDAMLPTMSFGGFTCLDQCLPAISPSSGTEYLTPDMLGGEVMALMSDATSPNYLVGATSLDLQTSSAAMSYGGYDYFDEFSDTAGPCYYLNGGCYVTSATLAGFSNMPESGTFPLLGIGILALAGAIRPKLVA